MPLQIKRALAMPFNDKQSLLAFAIGSLMSLPGAYAGTFGSVAISGDLLGHGTHLHLLRSTAPGWALGLSMLATFLSVGYMVRTMHAEFTNIAQGAPASLPSWGGNPVDFIVSFFANLVGGVLLAVGTLLFTAAWILLAILIFTFGMPSHFYATSEGGNILAAITILAALVFSPALLFAALSVPMMQAHYAHEDRFKAVVEWSKICSVTFRKFWSLLGITVLGGIAIAIVMSMAAVFYPLVAVVTFYGAVVFASLFAQVYLSQTKVSA
jgi:Protein of unknown function (DUF4013)